MQRKEKKKLISNCSLLTNCNCSLHTYIHYTDALLSSKAGFKFNIKKTKIMAIQYLHFMANRRGKSRSSDKFYFLGPKITADSDWSHEIKKKKKCLLLWRKAMTNLDSIFKGTDIGLLTKVRIVMLWFFFSSHIWMWELDHKESWAPKN